MRDTKPSLWVVILLVTCAVLQDFPAAAAEPDGDRAPLARAERMARQIVSGEGETEVPKIDFPGSDAAAAPQVPWPRDFVFRSWTYKSRLVPDGKNILGNWVVVGRYYDDGSAAPASEGDYSADGLTYGQHRLYQRIGTREFDFPMDSGGVTVIRWTDGWKDGAPTTAYDAPQFMDKEKAFRFGDPINIDGRPTITFECRVLDDRHMMCRQQRKSCFTFGDPNTPLCRDVTDTYWALKRAAD